MRRRRLTRTQLAPIRLSKYLMSTGTRSATLVLFRVARKAPSDRAGRSTASGMIARVALLM